MASERFEQGLSVRRRVLGDEYVDRALREADDFSRPLQELVTEVAWGTVWTRPGLSLRDRSLVTVAALTALGRIHELKIHIGAALRNGVTREELREVFLHLGIYAGMPAAVEAFRTAREVFHEGSR